MNVEKNGRDMQKINCIIIVSLFFTSLLFAMEQPGILTRRRAHQQRAARDQILAGIQVPVNAWSEESKQNYFNNYWHELLLLKSNYLKDAELSGHRCASSWMLSLLCTLGAYHSSCTACQICGAGGAILACMFGTEELVAACQACSKHAEMRTRIEETAENMGWKWHEFQ